MFVLAVSDMLDFMDPDCAIFRALKIMKRQRGSSAFCGIAQMPDWNLSNHPG